MSNKKDLIEKMMKLKSKNIEPSIVSESDFFKDKDIIETELPILNIAFTGMINGGLVPGLTILAGLSKCYKSLLGLYCMKAFLNDDPEAIAILYDSEFGITPDYLKSNGIDTSRVIHITITDIEMFKFDITQRLEQIDKKDKVFIMVDSIGNLASKKEVEDARDEKSVADMTRAKSLKSLFRIITPHLTIKNIPLIVINHIYSEQGLFPKNIISGGTGVLYSSNTAFIITKSQEKIGTDIVGWNFTINIEKSRFVREKSKLSFQVLYDEGINKYSSMLDLAIESGHVVKPSVGWFSKVNIETGEVEDKKYRRKETDTPEFMDSILACPMFNNFVTKKFKL